MRECVEDVYRNIFEFASELATYQPMSGEPCKIRVIRMSSRLDGTGEAGKRLAGKGVVFGCYAADLPRRVACGDKLVDAAGNGFEVVLQDGKSGWEYADPYQVGVKIFTREYRKCPS